MACELAEFLEHNPGEVDVVRLNSDRWTEDHKVMMEALTEGDRISGICRMSNSYMISRSVSRAQ